MVEKGSALFKLLDGLADSVIPLLAIVLLVLAIRASLARDINWRWWLGFVLGIAFVYLMRRIDSRLDLWEKIHSDYSTHSALTTAIVLPLISLRRAWLGALMAICAVYVVLMIILGFHTLLDIGTTLVVILPVLLAVYRWMLSKDSVADRKSVAETG